MLSFQCNIFGLQVRITDKLYSRNHYNRFYCASVILNFGSIVDEVSIIIREYKIDPEKENIIKQWI